MIDPGYAKVFIEETSKPNLHFCHINHVPFIATIHINDDKHKEVEIFLNNKQVLTIPIIEKGALFIIIKLTGGFVPKWIM